MGASVKSNYVKPNDKVAIPSSLPPVLNTFLMARSLTPWIWARFVSHLWEEPKAGTSFQLCFISAGGTSWRHSYCLRSGLPQRCRTARPLGVFSLRYWLSCFHSPLCPEPESYRHQPFPYGKARSWLPSQSRPHRWDTELSSKSISGVNQQLRKRSHFSARHKEKLNWSTHGLQQNPFEQHPWRRLTQCGDSGDQDELTLVCSRSLICLY